jgi:glycosyltransferase involved in cell wall biosynthesis
VRLLLLTAAELSRDPRARRAAAAAQERGLEVVGLCGRISGEEPVPLEGVEIVRVGPSGTPSGSWERAAASPDRPLRRELRGLYRLARLAARTLRLRRAGRRLGHFDVVHANDVDTLPAGWLLARSGARLVYDAHELYSEFEPDPPRLQRAVSSALERALARRADAVVTVSEPLADELVRRLHLGERPAVVLNAPELVPVDPRPAGNGPLRVVYQGAFGSGRPLEDLLDAAALAPSVRLTIRVVRLSPAAIRAEVGRRGLAERVEVAEPVPPTELVQALAGHEVGVIFDRPVTRNSELSAPNKLFEYVMAGLAVVAPRLPGLTALLDGVGETFDPGDPAALAATLEALAGDRGRVAALRRAAREAAVERFNAERQSAALATAWGL